MMTNKNGNTETLVHCSESRANDWAELPSIIINGIVQADVSSILAAALDTLHL